jgi:hypothetical protein
MERDRKNNLTLKAARQIASFHHDGVLERGDIEKHRSRGEMKLAPPLERT